MVEVATLDHGLHSGMWGGVVPDALTVLVRLLASLHDDDGNVAVAGLHEATAADVDYTPQRVRADTGLLDGVTEIGSGSVAQRLWAKPAITVIGIDTTPIAQASNTLIPRARAKVSMRVAPGGDAAEHLAALTRHLEQHAPWGAQVTVTARRRRPAVRDRRQRPGLRRGPARVPARPGDDDAVDTGVGGSIPFIAEFAAAFPEADDPRDRRRRPGYAGAQHQREPAPGRAGTGGDRRGPAVALAGQRRLAQADRSRRSLATWPVARMLYCANAILPYSSTTKVDRITPCTVLPYMVFSP